MSGDIEPMWAWQVQEEDGRWGTIMMTTMRADTGEPVDKFVLTNREETVIRGYMRDLAIAHKAMTGKPVRLHRFIPDPEFVPEEIGG
jgi:hypothetical protein